MDAIDHLLRGGATAVLLLLAGLNLRDHGRLVSVRLGAALALGACAYLIETLPGFRAATGLWSLPLFLLMAGNSVVFWLTVWALFDDGFRPRPWQALVWIGVAGLAATNAFVLGPMRLDIAAGIDRLLNLLDLIFAALAVWQAVASWPGDLVERRRHVRIAVVVGGALFAVVQATERGGGRGATSLDGGALLVLALVIAMGLLGVKADRLPAAARTVPATAPEDAGLLSRLDRLMVEQRLYREPRLSIADVARRMGLPEYRLRRLINQGRGERNFAGFVNNFRLAEVKAALADPAQAEVPVLTIALDAGFGSLGPFNRAFKADTGTTPTAFRQDALSKTAGRISKSA